MNLILGPPYDSPNEDDDALRSNQNVENVRFLQVGTKILIIMTKN